MLKKGHILRGGDYMEKLYDTIIVGAAATGIIAARGILQNS